MALCSKCGKDVKKMHSCQHTNENDYCVECYTELHYYLTESKVIDWNPGIHRMGTCFSLK